ncbi:SAM-dependent methyltransferase [Primorskyibacter flagellatus]|uniref:Methyltransferase n=1 Tax=Primorskyibacter flagellatus TaxID=1387277 RepID=A0A1W2EUV3_9RHOB|nr:SAM-dependent methyltransferase [Primorskyibacter flagellatus]SMD12948.1 hypothetical protein SAMN06295998_1443 [Primorskyibacter flagellatus]
MQNTSHAVMAQRVEAKDSLDDFPTPPWATRALVEHIIEQEVGTSSMSALEPACGRGYMAQALKEYFGTVTATDVHDYGYGETVDFLANVCATASHDWVITNPPFRRAEEFIQRSLPIARRGVAMLVRTVFIESVGRYERLFSQTPPSKVAQFVERVPMVRGRVDRKASTATGYAWVIWEKGTGTSPSLVWVPPCRKKLETDLDYEPYFLTGESPVETSRQQELFA